MIGLTSALERKTCLPAVAVLISVATAAVLLCGCAQSTPTPTLPSPALRQDAAAYAEAYDVSGDEAVRRLSLQDDIGDLNARLTAEEVDTFGGLWIQHEPDYRVLVLFTRNGRRTLRKYVKGGPLACITEARKAEATWAELESLQTATIQMLERIGSGAGTGIDVKNNCVALMAANPAALQSKLDVAGERLPDHVCTEPVGPYAAPPTLSVPPGVVFLRQAPPEGPLVEMMALLTGELVVADGCLRVRDTTGTSDYLIIWPYDHTLSLAADGTIQIHDGEGAVVARVGETIKLGGGETSSVAGVTSGEIPDRCTGLYWIAARGIETPR
jgi:hypothetical protein